MALTSIVYTDSLDRRTDKFEVLETLSDGKFSRIRHHVGLVTGRKRDVWCSSMDITSWSAEVWDEDKQMPIYVYVGDDMTPRGTEFVVEKDISPVLESKINTYYFEQKCNGIRAEFQKEICEPTYGKRVVVTRGRKVPIGTEGHIFHTGVGNYGPYAGLRLDNDETIWISLRNIEVIIDDITPPTNEQIKTRMESGKNSSGIIMAREVFEDMVEDFRDRDKALKAEYGKAKNKSIGIA